MAKSPLTGAAGKNLPLLGHNEGHKNLAYDYIALGTIKEHD